MNTELTFPTAADRAIIASFDGLCEYISELGCFPSSNLTDWIGLDDFAEISDASDLYDKIMENGNPFIEEFIYLSDAWDFLTCNGGDLSEPAKIAAEYSYSTEHITAYLLATLLSEQTNREQWYRHEDVITSYIAVIAAAMEE